MRDGVCVCLDSSNKALGGSGEKKQGALAAQKEARQKANDASYLIFD